MSWLDKMPWLSLLILFITYAVFGWSVSSVADSWVQWILETGKNLDLFLEEKLISNTIHLFALAVIIVISLCLTTLVALITFAFEKSIGSDLKAFLSVFFWSFILVLMFCFLDYFADLLVMISAAILVKLDLQKIGCKTWQTFSIIVFLASLAFGFGVISFEMSRKFYF
jgi:hypothetical protein